MEENSIFKKIIKRNVLFFILVLAIALIGLIILILFMALIHIIHIDQIKESYLSLI